MTYSFSRNFEKCFRRLPKAERKRVLRDVDIWQQNQYHPGLRFKRLAGRDDLWSMLSGQIYRRFGKRYGKEIL